MPQEERDIRRKIKVLEHACSSGNVSKTCRYFGISRETYYCWRWRGGVRDSVLAPDARIRSFKVGSALFSNLRH